ncbi:unnamed protein product [Vitrella brassicaformis CCMP3155]|uniref:Uncharacterized protein n=1 Tax=Vitrella brassicaformis (strain CCMP3155) TaxID=1169540 RepID=A0A0G4GP09_VITBC|nr:unnamed protein product [Vitrella brassicaformis CCMP3155]|eukprot:CEM32023.1 unnamed protein product [Vitrella brassicaformis CCMP3155]
MNHNLNRQNRHLLHYPNQHPNRPLIFHPIMNQNLKQEQDKYHLLHQSHRLIFHLNGTLLHQPMGRGGQQHIEQQEGQE